MRIIHTADWHLGKSLKQQSLIDDQEYILQEFLKLVAAEKPDAVIIAGDVYDRIVPPVEAVQIFDEVISKLVEQKVPVMCISGNHDGARRLKFGSRIFEQSQFFIETLPNEKPKTVVLEDKFGEVYFSLIPYFAPVEFEEKFGVDEVDADTANKLYVAEARKSIPAGKRSVAVAHVFVTGGKDSESERRYLGRVENVNVGTFAEYNYTALGHLHKPQTMKKTGYVVRYSGSILKYSFDEVNYDKGVTLVEVDEGETKFEHVKLVPVRDTRVVEGTVAELLKSEYTEDYIHANLTDEVHVQNTIGKLRNTVFPNILSLEYVKEEREVQIAFEQMLNDGATPLEQFEAFYEYTMGKDLAAEYYSAMDNFFKELNIIVR